MFLPGDTLHIMRTLAPQPPVPPEIEGFLKKLKRKTSNLTGSWNKRWFFVDPKRLEFGYAASKAPNAPRSSIYLNDITAVIQFDDTHFQVESRTRNFFLCGESKASTTCWVKSLDEYRKKLIEFQKDLLQRQVVASPVTTEAIAETAVAASNQSKPAIQKPQKTDKKKKPSTHEANPARDSLQDSSSLSISASSSSNLTDDKLPRHHGTGNVDDGAACDETPSPIDSSRRRETSRDYKPRPQEQGKERDRDIDGKSRERTRERDGGDRERRSRDGEREEEGRERRSRDSERERERSSRDRAKDRDRDRDRDADDDDERGSSKRDRSSSSQRRGNTTSGGSSAQGRTGSRTNSSKSQAQSLYAAHPSHGYVMHAWMDEYE